MAVRRPTGPSCGGGNNRPAYHQQAGSLRPSTNGSGPRNNEWNGRGNPSSRHYNQNNNRNHNFLPHQPVHFQARPQGNFHQASPRSRQNRRSQNQQGGGFNAPDHGHGPLFQQFQHNASRENPVPFQTGFQDHLSAPIPCGPKNRRRRNRRNQQTNAYNAFNAVLGVEMVDASHIDTDIEMPDAPPLECYYLDTWINAPTLLVAEGLASANDMLSRIEYFVRTGTMPADNFTFNG